MNNEETESADQRTSSESSSGIRKRRRNIHLHKDAWYDGGQKGGVSHETERERRKY